MADEEKKEGEGTPAPASEKQPEGAEGTKPKEPETIDYKAELERERERRKKAEDKIVELKKQKKEGENPEDDEFAEDQDEKLDKLVEEKVSKKLQGFQKTISRSEAEAKARALAKSDDEFKLIMFHYDNSIVLSGSVEEDIEDAWLKANKKKILMENNELKRAAISNNNLGRGESTGQKPAIEEKPPQVSPEDQVIIKRYGLVWDPKQKSFVPSKKKP